MSTGTPSDDLDPRQAFEELGRLQLSEHSLDSVMQKIAEIAARVVGGADAVSVTLVRGEHPSTVASTANIAVELDERQYERGFGPCLVAAEGVEVVEIPDMATEERFREFGQIAVEQGVRSSLTVPVPVQPPVFGALNMYSYESGAFDEEDREVAATLASYASVALANMHLFDSTRALAEQMENAMRSRAVIEQAKGVLMGRHGCSSDQAFDRLVTLSQNSNRKLREVAEEIVEAAAGGIG